VERFEQQPELRIEHATGRIIVKTTKHSYTSHDGHGRAHEHLKPPAPKTSHGNTRFSLRLPRLHWKEMNMLSHDMSTDLLPNRSQRGGHGCANKHLQPARPPHLERHLTLSAPLLLHHAHPPPHAAYGQVTQRPELIVLPHHLKPGAYTRSLFSSTRAVSDTQKHPAHPKHPRTPPWHGLHNPSAHPLSHKRAQVELRSERV